MKLRLRHTKLGKVRFTSSRDAARIWERALRRAELPVALSEGFTPRPKISFGLALPTGAESVAEYVDIDLRPDVRADDLDLDSLAGRLTEALPIGFDVLVVTERPTGAGSLQDSVSTCTWEFWHPRLTAEDHLRACELMAAPTLVIERERKGKRSVDDVRPLILGLFSKFAGGDLASGREGDGSVLVADLSTVGRGLRLSEFAELAYPGHDARDLRAVRTHQWTEGPDGRCEVLDAPAHAVAGPAGAAPLAEAPA